MVSTPPIASHGVDPERRRVRRAIRAGLSGDRSGGFAHASAAVRALEWFLRREAPKRAAATGRAARRTVPERAARATLRVDP